MEKWEYLTNYIFYYEGCSLWASLFCSQNCLNVSWHTYVKQLQELELYGGNDKWRKTKYKVGATCLFFPPGHSNKCKKLGVSCIIEPADLINSLFYIEQIYIRALSELLILQHSDCNNSDSIYWPDKYLQYSQGHTWLATRMSAHAHGSVHTHSHTPQWTPQEVRSISGPPHTTTPSRLAALSYHAAHISPSAWMNTWHGVYLDWQLVFIWIDETCTDSRGAVEDVRYYFLSWVKFELPWSLLFFSCTDLLPTIVRLWSIPKLCKLLMYYY